jgi:DsbC/DsbD-like thiol-disulfide interchange protein
MSVPTRPRRPVCPAALAAVVCLALAAGPARGAGPEGTVAEVSLLPGWRTAAGTYMAAFHFRLAPGWKTYWRAPGDGGIPPRFGWEGSRNLAEVRFHWPRPEVHEVGGLRLFGYTDELVLPIEITPRRPGEPVALATRIEFGVCEEVCVPMTARVRAELPSADPEDPRIRRALDERPLTAAEAGVGSVACEVAPIRDGLRLTAWIELPPVGAGEAAVFELPDKSIWISDARTRRAGARLEAASDLVPAEARPFALDRSEVRITVIGAARAVEIRGCPAGG